MSENGYWRKSSTGKVNHWWRTISVPGMPMVDRAECDVTLVPSNEEDPEDASRCGRCERALRKHDPPRRVPIPVSAAARIAKEYGYDQVIIFARLTGEDGGEHLTTYGKTRAHCGVAADCGRYLRREILGWYEKKPDEKPTAV